MNLALVEEGKSMSYTEQNFPPLNRHKVVKLSFFVCSCG